MNKNYQESAGDIKLHHDIYYKAFCAADTFTGPSKYFHTKAISLKESDDKERFLEATYAVLVSWGMHRMGAGGPKMVCFSKFYESAMFVWSDIEQAQSFDCQKMGQSQWELIEKIYDNIQIMTGKTHIVGKSKVLAHFLPHIIAPVDRQYTLAFLHGNKRIKIDGQWELLKNIMINFYYEVERSQEIQKFSDCLIQLNNDSGWNTSRLKIIDNLVIGAMKTRAI